MPSASSLFFVLFLLQKVTSGNILGIGRKFTEIFYAMEDTRRPKGHLGGHRRVPDAAPLGPAGGARPCPLGIDSAPSDAYKIPFNLKTTGRPLFSTEDIPTRRHLKP